MGGPIGVWWGIHVCHIVSLSQVFKPATSFNFLHARRRYILVSVQVATACSYRTRHRLTLHDVPVVDWLTQNRGGSVMGHTIGHILCSKVFICGVRLCSLFSVKKALPVDGRFVRPSLNWPKSVRYVRRKSQDEFSEETEILEKEDGRK